MFSLSFSTAQANLNAAMDRATADRAPIVIARRGRANVVMIAQGAWEAIEQTIRLRATIADRPTTTETMPAR